MISDRSGLRKPFINGGAIGAAICFFFAWRMAVGFASNALIIVGGIVSSSTGPILLASFADYPEIGQGHVGGASGVAMAAANAGGFLIPLLAITPLMAAGTQAAYDAGFLVTALLFVAGALAILGLRETGARARVDNGAKPATSSSEIG